MAMATTRADADQPTCATFSSTPLSPVHAARNLYKDAKVVLEGAKDAIKKYIGGQGWRFKCGSYQHLEHGPVNYVCSHFPNCNAVCRVVADKGTDVLQLQEPLHQEHKNHETGGVLSRRNGVFTVELQKELALLFGTGATPTNVYNTLLTTEHERVKELIPKDLKVEDLAKWKHGNRRCVHKIASLNELSAWMAQR